MNTLGRAHLANIQNLCIYSAAALSYGYGEAIKISDNQIETITRASNNLQNLVGITNTAIAEFSSSFSISDVLINKIQPSEFNIQIICELLLYSAAPNHEKYRYLRSLALRYRLQATPRLYYYLYILRNESLIHSAGDVNHTFWDPSYFISQIQTSYFTYSPFYGLSFGHPSFIFDNIYSFKRLGIKMNITFYESSQISRAYQGVGSQETLLHHSVAGALNVRSLEKVLTIDAEEAKSILLGNHFSHIKAFKALHRSTSEIDYTSYESLKRVNPCMSSSLSYLKSNPLFATFYTPSKEVRQFIKDSSRIVVIHTRDSAYSYSSRIRDSNFENYLDAVKWLISQDYSVVRISVQSNRNNFTHPQFLDLSRVKHSSGLIDQLAILQNADAFIGTSSGISHWATLYGIPLLILNCSAFPSCTLTSCAVHAGKNIEPLSDSQSTSAIKTIVTVLKFTFSCFHENHFRLSELSSAQVLEEIVSFIQAVKEPSAEPLTLHMPLSELDVEIKSIPDIYISNPFGERARNTFATSLGHRFCFDI
jgi:putative glycosyltransferase (TIGR04372 family)